MTNPIEQHDEATVWFLSVRCETPAAAVAAYHEALELGVPGSYYASASEDGAVLTSVTFGCDDHAVATNAPPFATGEVVVLDDEVAQGLGLLAEVGLCRDFITDQPVQVIALDGEMKVGGELRRRKIGRNEPCPCDRRPQRKFKRCCGLKGQSR